MASSEVPVPAHGAPAALHETELGLLPSDWSIVRIGEVADVGTGGTPSTNRPEYYAPGTIPWMKSGDIYGTYIHDVPGRISPAGLASSNATFFPAGSVAIALSGQGKTRATTAILRIDLTCSQSVAVMIPRSDVLFGDYLHYQLVHQYQRLRELTGDKGRSGLNLSIVRAVEIPLPPLPEQRRIAAVLNAIQEAIAAQEDVIAAARQFKRSLMQRLFTYGPGREPAETKETEIGEIPAHWEVVKLGDVATLQRGYDLPKQNRKEGIVPIVTSSGISGTHDEAKVRGPGVVTGRYGTLGDVYFIESDFWPHNTTLFVNHFHGNNPRFVARLLERTRLGALNDKTSVPGINRNHAHQLPIGRPPIAEQKMIDEMLNAADAKTAAEEDRKTALDALFKSMLHQLMTGQIRLLADAGLELPLQA